jgi:hypothetical protein
MALALACPPSPPQPQRTEFPAAVWRTVLRRLEALVRRSDPGALALTRKLFTAENMRLAILSQP